jgi:hypothetical protein
MKLLIRLGFVGLALVVMLFLGVAFFVDSIAQKAVEKGGTAALGVETRLESVDIGLLAGSFRMEGLGVANPPGFTEKDFLSLGYARFDLPLSSLTSDRIVAPLLELEDVFIALEQDGKKSNYGAILDNLDGVAGGGGKEEPQPAPEDEGGGKSFIIDEIVIRGVQAKVKVGVAGASTGATVDIPEIVLKDLASREFTMKELMSFVIVSILERASAGGIEGMPDEILNDLRGQLSDLGSIELEGQSLDDLKKTGEDLKKTGETLKGLFDKD